MAIKLATAWIKNSIRFMILFHKDKSDGRSGTKGKSNEQGLKEFTHPRVEVVVHQIPDGIGHGNPRNERHDTTGNNEISIGRKTTILRTKYGQKSQKTKAAAKAVAKGMRTYFSTTREKAKARRRNTCSNRIIKIPAKHNREKRGTKSSRDG